MTARYDAIVLGLGAMGSAATYYLARSGKRVLGLDAYPRGHANGSSHGHSRGIREAYAESPRDAPLVQRAYTLWRALEEESGEQLLTITGRLGIGPTGGAGSEHSQIAAHQYGIPIEELTADAVMERFPGFRVPAGYVGIYESRDGFLQPEACVRAHLDGAARAGAVVRHADPVRAWHPDGDGVRVETGTDVYHADRLVVTAGPWAGGILADLGLPLEPWRMYLVYFAPTRPALFGPDRCPNYSLNVPEGYYYGIPNLPGEGLKIGRHDRGEACTPETAQRSVSDREVDAMRAILDTYMPGAAGAVREVSTCLYTMTPDGLHPRPAPGARAGGLRMRFLGARFQVRERDRRGAGRARDGRRNAARYRLPLGGAVRGGSGRVRARW